MNTVTNQTYYHISDKGFNVGQKLSTGVNKNDFISFFDKTDFIYVDIHTKKPVNLYVVASALKNFIVNGTIDSSLAGTYSYNIRDTAKYLVKAIDEYIIYVRESIFEEVRKEKFPTYPSRYKCVWLAPNDNESVKFWWSIFCCALPITLILFEI